jgi:hypothetical protein
MGSHAYGHMIKSYMTQSCLILVNMFTDFDTIGINVREQLITKVQIL